MTIPEVKFKSRCSGHCCRSFSIAKSPEQFRRDFEMKPDDPARPRDIDKLHNMLIYLGQFHTNPLLRIKGESWAQKALQIARNDEPNNTKLQMEIESKYGLLGPHRGQHWYACRHVQLNGDCGIYEDRPELCRLYPNGQECSFEDCTFEKGDQDKHRLEVWDKRDDGLPRLQVLERADTEERELIPAKALTRRKRLARGRGTL
jgi:Fe-S-cluster containining protein